MYLTLCRKATGPVGGQWPGKDGCRRLAAERAFTLLELLIVIAIVVILASLIFPALAKAKNKAAQVRCLGNLRQIQVGFHLYLDDYRDIFPAPGSRDYYGQQDEDWLWWHRGRQLEGSAIAPYVGNAFPAELLMCPLDKKAGFITGGSMQRRRAYPFSYALTSYNLSGRHNPGLATIITKEEAVYPFKRSSVVRPATKIMLVEEDERTIDDSRWVPEGSKTNLVTSRHLGRGVCLFVDGHIETVKPVFGLNPLHSLPLHK